MARVLAFVIALLAACGSPRTPAGADTEEPVPAVFAPVTDAGVKVAGFYCYSWVHGTEFSTPCYRTRDACDVASAEMQSAHRDVTPCEGMVTAWCALLDEERCFETGSQCARYLEAFAPEGKQLPSCQTRQ